MSIYTGYVKKGKGVLKYSPGAQKLRVRGWKEHVSVSEMHGISVGEMYRWKKKMFGGC